MKSYINAAHRHSIICKCAEYCLKKLTDKQIVDSCPLDYGAIVTDDHRSLIWDRLYDEFDMMGDDELIRKSEEILQPIKVIEEFNNLVLSKVFKESSGGGNSNSGGLM